MSWLWQRAPGDFSGAWATRSARVLALPAVKAKLLGKAPMALGKNGFPSEVSSGGRDLAGLRGLTSKASAPLFTVERTCFMNRSCLDLISLFLYSGCLINSSVTCAFIFLPP